MTQKTPPEQAPFSQEEWAQTPPAVQAFVWDLVAHVQQLENELSTLHERTNRSSRNSSKPPSSDGPEVARKPRKQSDPKRKPGGQVGHKGTQRKLVAVESVKACYDLKPEVCHCCGHLLSECSATEGQDREPYRHQVTEIPPVVAQVTEYRLHTWSCPECGSETRAELPAGVPQGAFGPRLQATVALLSGRYHLSKRDTAAVLDDLFQVEVGDGSVCTLEQRTSEAVSAPVEQARAYVQEQSVVHMDETGWRENNQKAWLWVVATCLVTVFLIRASRGGQVAREMLGESFKGILNSDRWSAYNWVAVDSRQLCWAHLLRDFQAFVERGGESQRIGEAILSQSELMFEWWHRVRDGTMTRAVLQEKMTSVQQEVGNLLRQGAACAHDNTAGTCRDILKREAALWTFVRVEGPEPTNNLAERQIRPGVLWRKSSFGTQSQAGSQFAERIMTVVATLKQQQRNVLDYLVDACDAANWKRPAPSLLPRLPTP